MEQELEELIPPDKTSISQNVLTCPTDRGAALLGTKRVCARVPVAVDVCQDSRSIFSFLVLCRTPEMLSFREGHDLLGSCDGPALSDFVFVGTTLLIVIVSRRRV